MVISLKAAGLWTAALAIYPFVGGAATPHSMNLRSSSYQITWVNGPTHNANGVTGNGTTQYGQCVGLTGNSVYPHLGCMGAYVRVAHSVAESTGRICGLSDGTSYYSLDRCNITGFVGNRAIAGVPSNVATDNSATKATKFVAMDRSSTTRLDCYVNGSSASNNTTLDTTTPPSFDAFILAVNQSGSINAAGDANLALTWFGPTLSSGNHATLASIIQTYQTALSRQV